MLAYSPARVFPLYSGGEWVRGGAKIYVHNRFTYHDVLESRALHALHLTEGVGQRGHLWLCVCVCVCVCVCKSVCVCVCVSAFASSCI
jgi:hypothetical protein